MMHFLGGLTLAIFVAWILRIESRSFKSFLKLLVCVMFLGVGWEVFEYVFGIAAPPEEYLADTSLDIIMDTIGLVAAYYHATSSSSSRLS